MTTTAVGTALDDLRALLRMTRDAAERERIAALVSTLAARERRGRDALDSSYTPAFLIVLEAQREREPLTHGGGETWL